MSFLSILKTVGADTLKVASIAGPIVSMFDPAIGAPVTVISNLIIKAEQTFVGEKQGTAKKQYVLDELAALLPLFQDAIKNQFGYVMAIDETQISHLIDATVAQFNAASAIKSSFSFTKV